MCSSVLLGVVRGVVRNRNKSNVQFASEPDFGNECFEKGSDHVFSAGQRGDGSGNGDAVPVDDEGPVSLNWCGRGGGGGGFVWRFVAFFDATCAAEFLGAAGGGIDGAGSSPRGLPVGGGGGGAEQNFPCSARTVVVRVASFSTRAGSLWYLVGRGGISVALSSLLIWLNKCLMSSSTVSSSTPSSSYPLISESYVCFAVREMGMMVASISSQ